MSAGAALARKCSLSRGLVCPVLLGRVLVIVVVSGAGPLPRPGGCCGRGAPPLPPPAGAFGAFGAGGLSPWLGLFFLTLSLGFPPPLPMGVFRASGPRLEPPPRRLL